MFRKEMGRAFGMKLAILAVISLTTLIGFVRPAFAQNYNNAPEIFDVRRSLPLEPNEPVFHDFYINAGPEAGFKKGMYVMVVRSIPVHDPIQNKQQGTLNITIGRLHVIHVERGITVARLESELTDEERPTLEFEAVMIGDRIDTNSATMEVPKNSGKKPARNAKRDPSSDEKVEVKVQMVPEPTVEAAASAPGAISPAPVTPVTPAMSPAVAPGPAVVPAVKPGSPALAPIKSEAPASPPKMPTVSA